MISSEVKAKYRSLLFKSRVEIFVFESGLRRMEC